MASKNNLITAFFATSLLASGVQGQTDLTLSTCDATNADADNGKNLRTYEILCDEQNDGTAIANPITKGTTFNTLCQLLDSGPWVTSDSQTVDLKTYLATGTNEHTFLAPTDAAFANIQDTVDALFDLQSSDILAFGNIVSSWLQLHITEGTYLIEDYECDETVDTLNLASSVMADQRQKTRCRGDAFTFDQIGAGNVGDSDQPTIGLPTGVFTLAEFATNSFTKVTTDLLTTSSNIIGCNGVIHVVDEALQPGPNRFRSGSKGGKSGKGSGRYYRRYYGYRYRRSPYVPYYFPNRGLEESENEVEEVEHDANIEDRRARLESLLVDADGKTEELN